ncbi:myogenesis-regulating glycosidase-like [Phlebotomus argentipes]|uniref:myogenesis-regulating glycosidase-like n=1 Tax=Phlebotomus argentipes TaxID=94469 RepID=UPI0028936436|nr:myogenesis-regulating glycosidase-like [Phlebotomus argentipes]
MEKKRKLQRSKYKSAFKWGAAGITATVIFVLIEVFIIHWVTPFDDVLRVHFQKAGVHVQFEFELTEDGVTYTIHKNRTLVQVVRMGANLGWDVKVENHGNGKYVLRSREGSVSFNRVVDEDGLAVFHINQTVWQVDFVEHCFDLVNPDGINWFAGPLKYYQYWPSQRLQFTDDAYLPKESSHSYISERYWLTSKGLFVYFNERVPLFLNRKPNHLCFAAKQQNPYYTYGSMFSFNYTIGVASNAKRAHQQAVGRYLRKPLHYPDRRIIQYPKWIIRNSNRSLVQEYVDNLMYYDFNTSSIILDRSWEVCHGALEFDPIKFLNVEGLIRYLRRYRILLTLTVSPRIHEDCNPYFQDALSRGFLVKTHQNSYLNFDRTATVDFTNPAASWWFMTRLKNLQLIGVDNFYFEGGEFDSAPNDPNFEGVSTDLHPIQYTVDSVRAMAEFCSGTILRTGFCSQDLPVLVKIPDLENRWDIQNGLEALIPKILQTNLNGYYFLMVPIGGVNPVGLTKDLYIRWMQAAVFTPSMAFSTPPWEFDDETIELTHKFLKLHINYLGMFMDRFKLAKSEGDPVNLPIWWLYPANWRAQETSDQYLLGDDVIVAPVLHPNTTERGIFLPYGIWRDGNDNSTVFQGPRWLPSYRAPLDVLPYFVRIGAMPNIP